MFADKLQMSENEKSSAHVSATCADGSRVVETIRLELMTSTMST